MVKPDHIISLSLGKDSTAMLHQMIERREKISAVVFCDTGWEFPGMYDHLNLIKKKTGLKIWRIHPWLPFDYVMLFKPLRSKETGKIHRHGNGWPSPLRRWCTREKVNAIDHFSKAYANPIQCVGYAADEKHRDKNNSKYSKRYPLIEYGMTEKDALEYCYSLGYHWGGLYEHFDRVSCFCCPLQRIGELRKLRKHFPGLWDKMIGWDKSMPVHNKGFKDYKSVQDFDNRFFDEDLWEYQVFYG